MKGILNLTVSLALLASSATALGWDPDEVEEYDAKSQEAIATFKEKDPSVQRFFDAASGYVVIPTVGKAGFGLGGARGKGILNDNENRERRTEQSEPEGVQVL